MATRSARRRARTEARLFRLFVCECEQSHFAALSATGRAAFDAVRRHGEADPWSIRYTRAVEWLRLIDVPATARIAWNTGAPLPWV